MVRTCPYCGCSEIDEDAARGDATCTGCGTVLEESIVVAENQFQERAGGSGHTLVGQFISAERQSHTLQGVPGLVSQESRELTFQKGKRLIEEIASQLRINQFCIDTSYNFFKMCVIKNLTRGRVRSHVVASCMYMTCRIENTPHLLLDFSDVTQVNVFDLGRCLSFLSRSLRITLPSTDPCLYVMRFACLLEFGERQKEVVNLATRLVERMKRDWISTGRRPTGLCGAALLIAARAFNFNRSIGDVVRVVHISETVVRKRLEEFSQTPSGALSIDDFRSIDLEQSEDPPAFLAARKKAQLEALKEEQKMAENMAGDVQQMEMEVEKALEKKRREKFKASPYAKELSGIDEIDAVSKKEAVLITEQIMETVYEAADNEEQGPSNSFAHLKPTLTSLGIKKQEASYMDYIEQDIILPAADNANGDLNLSDIDDDEIDSYILSNAESELKERIWMKMNGEHLKEMERRKREREEAESKEQDPKKKKRKPPTQTNRHPNQENGEAPSTAAEAIEKVIQEKKLSNKVNYDILKEIDHAMPGPSQDELLPKPIPIFTAPNLIRRERQLARKNINGASAQRLNLVKEALNMEAEPMKVVKKEESLAGDEDSKTLLSKRAKARPNFKMAPPTMKKAAVEVNGAESETKKTIPLLDDVPTPASSPANVPQIPEIEPTVSPEPEVVEVVKPPTLSRLQRKKAGPLVVKIKKKEPVSPQKQRVAPTPIEESKEPESESIDCPEDTEGVPSTSSADPTPEVPKPSNQLRRGKKAGPVVVKLEPKKEEPSTATESEPVQKEPETAPKALQRRVHTKPMVPKINR